MTRPSPTRSETSPRTNGTGMIVQAYLDLVPRVCATHFDALFYSRCIWCSFETGLPGLLLQGVVPRYVDRIVRARRTWE